MGSRQTRTALLSHDIRATSNLMSPNEESDQAGVANHHLQEKQSKSNASCHLRVLEELDLKCVVSFFSPRSNVGCIPQYLSGIGSNHARMHAISFRWRSLKISLQV